MSCNFFGVLLGACQLSAAPPPEPRLVRTRPAVVYVDGRRVNAPSVTGDGVGLCAYDTSPFERLNNDRPAQDYIDETSGGPPRLNGRDCRLPIYRDPRY